jgi:hypothetical protein
VEADAFPFKSITRICVAVKKLEDLGNFGIDGRGSRGRRPTLYNGTLLVNEEFLEIPL